MLVFFFPSERQSSLGHAPHEDPQSHYDLPVNSHIPGHYDLPPLRRPPSPSLRRSPHWHSHQQRKSPSSSYSSPSLCSRERAKLYPPLESLPPRSCFCLLQRLLFDSTLPLCGLKWYSLHQDSPVIQAKEPTGCREEAFREEGCREATPAGLQLLSTLTGNTKRRLQGSNVFCVQTYLNRLKIQFSTHLAWTNRP